MPPTLAEEVAGLADVIWMDHLLELLSALPNQDRWDAVAKSSLRDDLYRLAIALTFDALTSDAPGDASELVAQWAQ